jgi:CDP-glucose 4,6-dehydratase
MAANPLVLDTAKMEIRAQTLDASKARDVLGWEPVWTLERGLEETVRWYREHFAKMLSPVTR